MRNIVQIMDAIAFSLIAAGASLAASEPLKIYILAGQSNMQGHVNISTFDSMADEAQWLLVARNVRMEVVNYFLRNAQFDMPLSEWVQGPFRAGMWSVIFRIVNRNWA